ncbi:hypothetical protein [Leptolyngbya sp. Heron Island J]|uniref:hypothetical protein n=1 Tax=Leptolyngbya sp. Heron Island J TaxID=1385935 RepID=UPI00041EA71A|nr:hypothetical protein [Leptolyngbya sp. Heron Island J]
MQRTAFISVVLAIAIVLFMPTVALGSANSTDANTSDVTDTVTPKHRGGSHHGGHGNHGGCY